MPAFETLPVANAIGAGDYTLVVQGGVLKKLPPVNVIEGVVPNATPVVIDMVANGLLGSFLLNMTPASGCSILVETSRDSQVSYQQVGGSAWTTALSMQYSKAPTDTNYVTHVRLTRTAGSLGTTTYTLTNGYVAFTGAQNDMIGVIRSKALVVDVTLRTYNVDPTNDRGWLFGSYGIDQNIIYIRAQAVAPWDETPPCAAPASLPSALSPEHW